jgi:hypothetical protein
MRSTTRHLYLITSLLVSLSACARVAADPMSMMKNGDSLRLYQFVLGVLIVTWLIKDPKLPKAERPSFDHGLLHLAFFPIMATYEQFVLHGWKGIAVVLGLLILLIAPFFTMLIQFSVA